MNKSGLINAISEITGLSKIDSKKAIKGFTTAVTNELKQGGKICLVGFGTFSVAEKSARQGINPRTMQPIQIEGKKAVKFKPGAELANAVK